MFLFSQSPAWFYVLFSSLKDDVLSSRCNLQESTWLALFLLSQILAMSQSGCYINLDPGVRETQTEPLGHLQWTHHIAKKSTLVTLDHWEFQDVCYFNITQQGFPGGSEVKNPPTNSGDMGLIPGLGRRPGEGNDNLLQYSCLENSMDRGAWWATVHRVAKESDMTWWLNNNHHNDPTHPVVYKIQKDRMTLKDLTCCEMKEWDWVPRWPMLSGPTVTEDLHHLPLLVQDEEWKGKDRDHSPPGHWLWVLVGHLIVWIILISMHGQ